MFSRVQSMTNTYMALQLTYKFEQLDIDGLPVEEAYLAVLQQYSEDILTVAEIYEKNKKKPDVARGAPPVAGTLHFCHTMKLIAVNSILRRIIF